MESQYLQFSSGEPYYSILHMPYGYFSAEDVDYLELKTTLQKIRLDLTTLFIMYFQLYGNENVIQSIIQFLLHKIKSSSSIRVLFSILMTH